MKKFTKDIFGYKPYSSTTVRTSAERVSSALEGIELYKEKVESGARHKPLTELVYYIDLIKSALRGVNVEPFAYDRAYVYVESEGYVRGTIGVTEEDSEYTYNVISHHISNKRYNSYNAKFFRKSSTNVDVAVRNAKRFLRPFTLKEIMGDNYNAIAQPIRSKVEDKKLEAITQYGEMTGVRPDSYHMDKKVDNLLTELKHLIANGHTFVSQEFANNAASFVSTMEDRKRMLTSIPMRFVHVTEYCGVQMANTLSCLYEDGSMLIDDTDMPEAVALEDLPDDITGKLAVLNIGEPKHFMDNVGMNLGDNMFYVYESEDATH